MHLSVALLLVFFCESAKIRVVCYILNMKKSIKSPIRLSSLTVEFDRETDGRWIAEIPKLPGVMAYGATKRDALQGVYAIFAI